MLNKHLATPYFLLAVDFMLYDNQEDWIHNSTLFRQGHYPNVQQIK
jgi:hypothetical protein